MEVFIATWKNKMTRIFTIKFWHPFRPTVYLMMVKTIINDNKLSDQAGGVPLQDSGVHYLAGLVDFLAVPVEL